MSSEQTIQIVMACDNGYVPFTSTALYSLLENSLEDWQYSITILHNDISAKNQEILKSLFINSDNINLDFYYLEVDNSMFHLESHQNVSTYYRLFIPKIFKNHKRVVYLDCDIVINSKDFIKLAQIDFENKLALAAREIKTLEHLDSSHFRYNANYYKDYLGIKDLNNYFNAGIMVFNVEKMNEINIFEHFSEAVKNIKKPLFVDQDILNSVLSKLNGVKIIHGSYNFNYFKPMDIAKYKNRTLIEEIKQMDNCKNPNIVHFITPKKPWLEKIDSDNFFWKYALKNPIYEKLFDSNLLKFSGEIAHEKTYFRSLVNNFLAKSIIKLNAPTKAKVSLLLEEVTKEKYFSKQNLEWIKSENLFVFGKFVYTIITLLRYSEDIYKQYINKITNLFGKKTFQSLYEYFDSEKDIFLIVTEYAKKMNLKEIVIYGGGEIFEKLKPEFDKNNIKILFGIDQKAKEKEFISKGVTFKNIEILKKIDKKIFVFILSVKYTDEIKSAIKKLENSNLKKIDILDCVERY